jgi:TonB family protein
MIELKTLVPKTDRHLSAGPHSRNSQEPKQRRMMVTALTLLLISLGFVLYRDRDFWFPNTLEARETLAQLESAAPAVTTTHSPSVVSKAHSATHKMTTGTKPQPKTNAPTVEARVEDAPADSSAPPITAITTRTVLPPLEVEVVAGDTHRTLHPGTNSVRVDLQAGSPPMGVSQVPSPGETADTAASVTSNAAEHVQMSADTVEIVRQPVKPGYPLLARQMKVQGSVILQALIGRDGLIQDLRVLSGPPILASAAQEAVKQWHFKPHFQGAAPVETLAKITVNFTISTN